MPEYHYRITEEVARWTFEAYLKRFFSPKEWFVAFSNPTAGPWKRVMGLEAAGNWGEVHRFQREEERPDLVVVSDPLQTLLIIEAKDSARKLRTDNQVEKSCSVILELGATLASKGKNPYWGHRAGYLVVPGLLWAARSHTRADAKQSLARVYMDELAENTGGRGLALSPCILMIEVLQKGNSMICNFSSPGDCERDEDMRRVLASLRRVEEGCRVAWHQFFGS